MTQTALTLASDLIRQFEGCRTVAYLDPGGIASIGYGHTTDVHLGMVCAQTQADAWLTTDITRAASVVSAAVHVPLSDHQMAALISLVFNIGAGNFRASTLLKLLNAGGYEDAGKQFARWSHDHQGQLLNGLVRRRAAELAMWNRPDQEARVA